MNNILDQILGRPQAQKIGILAGIIILLAALYYTFLYSPRSDELTKSRDEIETARSQRSIKQRRVANLGRLQKDLIDLDFKLKEAVAQLPDKKEIPDLLSKISTKARESGLEILLFRPRAENYQEFYAQIPVDIVVRGGFYNAVAFFDEVGKLKRLVNIDNIDFKTPKVAGEQLSLDISTLATTFRFLDETERKKVAEEKAKAAKK
jgi:type IV pilus assembly protein PilO